MFFFKKKKNSETFQVAFYGKIPFKCYVDYWPADVTIFNYQIVDRFHVKNQKHKQLIC